MDEQELIEKCMPSEELIIEWSRKSAMLPDVVARHVLEYAIPLISANERERIIKAVDDKSCVIDWEDDELGVMREMKEADWQALQRGELPKE